MPESAPRPDTSRASCRWNSLAGHYIFGEIPTLADPRAANRADTDLTNVHEQTHRDLINNTLYGYILMRLHDLQKLGEAVRGCDIDRSIRKLAGKVFLCAEGSATAMELLTDDQRRSKELPSDPQAIFDALPEDYKQAVSLYLPLIGRQAPFPPPFDFLVNAALLQAVTELSLDWTALHVSAIPSFWELVDLLADSRPADEILPEMVQVAQQLPVVVFAFLLDAQQQVLADDLKQGFRNLVAGFKIALLQASGTAPKEMPAVLDETERIGIFKRLDEGLYKDHPELRPIFWQTEKVLGSVLAIDVKEPDFLLVDETVEPANLPQRMRELARMEGFHLFVVNFFRFPDSTTYTVIANPTTILDGKLDLGPTYLVSKGVTAEQLHGIDTDPANEAHEVNRVWLTTGLAVLVDGGFYDWEFAASLQLPVFIRLLEFSWEALAVAAKAFSGDREFILYRVPGLAGISAGAGHIGSRTVFGLTVPSDLPPASLGFQNGVREIWEYPNFSPAFIVNLRTSRTETV